MDELLPRPFPRAIIPDMRDRLKAMGVSYWETRQRFGAEQLSEGERSVVSTACEKRVGDFSTGRYCARMALEPYGLASVEIPARPTRAPHWPKGLVGSITHTDGFAAAAVAETDAVAAVGIDAEIMRPGKMKPGMVELILTDEERRRWGSGASAESQRHAYVVFSAKEALFKALHPLVERFFGFHDAEVLDLNAERGTFQIRLRRSLGPGLASGAVLDGIWEERGELVVTALALPEI